jgi:hypothetical protein
MTDTKNTPGMVAESNISKDIFVNANVEYSQAVKMLQDQFKWNSDRANQYVNQLFADYTATVQFNDVLQGKYYLDVKGCFFSTTLATYFSWAVMEVTVTVGSSSKSPAYFTATINPKATQNKVDPYTLSFGIYDGIEVTGTSIVKAAVKILDNSHNPAKIVDIDTNHTSVGFTLFCAE